MAMAKKLYETLAMAKKVCEGEESLSSTGDGEESVQSYSYGEAVGYGEEALKLWLWRTELLLHRGDRKSVV